MLKGGNLRLSALKWSGREDSLPFSKRFREGDENSHFHASGQSARHNLWHNLWYSARGRLRYYLTIRCDQISTDGWSATPPNLGHSDSRQANLEAVGAAAFGGIYC